MLFVPLILVWINLITFVRSLGPDKMCMQGNFSEDVFTIQMTYSNISVDVMGHALSANVKECLSQQYKFAPHCIKQVQTIWPLADQGMQRIPEFYFIATNNTNFSYYYDFGADSPLFEGQKCCIIYDLLDCIHNEYKQNLCMAYSFGAIDEILHSFAMEFENRCDGFYTQNQLYKVTKENIDKYHNNDNDRDKDKSCKRMLNSSHPMAKSNASLISLVLLSLLKQF